MTPNASNRATTKDILRHEWLVHGPVLSIQLNSTTFSSVSLADQQSCQDLEKIHLQVTTPINDKSLSPTNSLVELELHTSSFFDTAKLTDNQSKIIKEQRRHNRISVIPESTCYYSSNNSKPNSSLSSSCPSHRRPLSLSIDDQHSLNPTDHHVILNNEKSFQLTSTQPYTSRRSRRTLSPTSIKTSSNYVNNNRANSPSSNRRYTLVTSSDRKKSTSPINPSRYVVSYDFETTLRDYKRKPLNKHTPPTIIPTSELNVVPSLLNSTTPVTPSIFTTSTIKFAPVPNRRMSPLNDEENTMNNSSTRLLNNIGYNPSSNLDDSINTATTKSHYHHSSLTPFELSSTTNTFRNNRLLDDNNNLISFKVHD